MNGGRGAGATSIRRNGKAPTTTIKPFLDPDGSAALRDQLLTDVDRLSSADAAATWAHRIMAAKNSLAAADARRVEDAFAAKMATLGSGDGEVINAPLSSSELGQARLPQNPPQQSRSKCPFQPRRQEPARVTRAASVSGQGPPQIRGQATLSDLRPPACGCASPSVRTTSCARAQGERRIHRPAVPRPSSRGAPIRRRSRMVEQSRYRSHRRRPALWLETHPLPTASDKTDLEGATSLAAVSAGQEVASVIGRSANEAQIAKRSQ